MQGLPHHVNTLRDCRRRSRTSNEVGSRSCRQRRLEGALPVMRLGNPGRLAHAIIRVGLAIAAADREENLGAEQRGPCAGAERIGEEAGSGRMLAELALGTLKAGKAAALPGG